MTKIILTACLFLSATFGFAQQNKDTDKDLVFSRVEIEAHFPGGDAAWNQYISKAFADAGINWRNKDQGTCRIRFIVDTHGNITDAEALTMKKSRLAKFAIETITNGPKWIPASQNGRLVKAFREQPISLRLEEEVKIKK